MDLSTTEGLLSINDDGDDAAYEEDDSLLVPARDDALLDESAENTSLLPAAISATSPVGSTMLF